jgi:hemoglobin
MEQTLFDKFGGIEGLAPVVDEFYKRVLGDESVSSFFDSADMEQLRKHQTRFFSFAFGGTNQYTGKSMENAHKGLNLQPTHFQTIVKHLYGTLHHFGVGQQDIAKVLGIIAPLRENILYK